MITLSVAPTRAQFRPGEEVGLRIDVRGANPGTLRLVAVLTGGAPLRAPGQGDRAPHELTLVVGDDGTVQTDVALPSPASTAPDGHAIGFAVLIEDPATGVRATTAFDVAAHWTSAPRYGFFADFSADESAELSRARADAMLALHINVVQFYDWMYSHHTLVPPTADFVDPLGRHLSRDVAQRKVDLAHERGMAAIAYGALYGAEVDFADQHPDWLLYDGRHERLELAEIFYLQDIREVSGWRRWIIDQYRDTIARMGFDGIHIDQYGYPKRSLSRATGEWEEVVLAEEFTGFVEQACTEVLEVAPEGGSIFNLVNAWPLESMPAVSADAATYIEVWEPHSTYRDLYDLIRRSRELRPDKHVILAAYLRAFHPVDGRQDGAMTAFRLAWATINAAGGFHLLAGEGTGLLTEAYYPNYGTLTGDDAELLRSYADFAVRHTAALHGGATDVAWTQVGPTNDVVLLEHPDLPTAHRAGYSAGAVPGTVWVVAREYGATTVLNLVNLVGIETELWNSAQPTVPAEFAGIRVRVAVTGDISGVWWDTPDDGIGEPRAVDFAVVDDDRGRFLEFSLPSLSVWSLVWWERAG
ncbi:glycoside hydrolase family 66 protein [Homoserinibacter sp. GY 40078]|uniref:glycoside hydrolase family 66 protein n=1 Tax=Homoserinibacter sp. GY 40078 TaxID=2603275 RepID=UPI00164FD2BE|nr:glycoside hydrolase family 66 protein [Homoserinibacter sp. GY 40078]